MPCNGGSTPLHLAAMKEDGSLEIAFAILDAFALSSFLKEEGEKPPDPRSIPDTYSNTPLHIARRNCKTNECLVLKLLDSSQTPLQDNEGLRRMREWMAVESKVEGREEGGPCGVVVEPCMTRSGLLPLAVKHKVEDERDMHHINDLGSIEYDDEDNDDEEEEGWRSDGVKRRRVRSECSVNYRPDHDDPNEIKHDHNQEGDRSTIKDEDNGSSVCSNEMLKDQEGLSFCLQLQLRHADPASDMTPKKPSLASIKPSKNVPSCFVCPLTLDLMRDPVLLIKDGVTYEREAILLLDKDPILVPNLNLKEAIELWASSQKD